MHIMQTIPRAVIGCWYKFIHARYPLGFNIFFCVLSRATKSRLTKRWLGTQKCWFFFLSLTYSNLTTLENAICVFFSFNFNSFFCIQPQYECTKVENEKQVHWYTVADLNCNAQNEKARKTTSHKWAI